MTFDGPYFMCSDSAANVTSFNNSYPTVIYNGTYKIPNFATDANSNSVFVTSSWSPTDSSGWCPTRLSLFLYGRNEILLVSHKELNMFSSVHIKIAYRILLCQLHHCTHCHLPLSTINLGRPSKAFPHLMLQVTRGIDSTKLPP